jgi:hypothetical protein
VLGQEGVAVEGEGLSEKQWAVVKYTDAMTREVKVNDEVFAELRKHFSDREVVEITTTVGLRLWREVEGDRQANSSYRWHVTTVSAGSWWHWTVSHGPIYY